MNSAVWWSQEKRGQRWGGRRHGQQHPKIPGKHHPVTLLLGQQLQPDYGGEEEEEHLGFNAALLVMTLYNFQGEKEEKDGGEVRRRSRLTTREMT